MKPSKHDPQPPFSRLREKGTSAVAFVILALLGQPVGAADVTLQPPTSDPQVAPYTSDPRAAAQVSDAELTALLRAKIKYVFVIFNENHSFDNEFGTFPGVDGLYSTGQAPRAAAQTPGFTQVYTDVAGVRHEVRPFRLGPRENANVIDSVDHGHKGLARKLAVVNGTPTMAGFAQDEYSKSAATLAPGSDARGKQFANIVMSHIDCDTIPFYWRYANRFTIFDRIFATEDTPSTPNAIAMIAGQSGETQWVRHGSAGVTQGLTGSINGTSYEGQTGTTRGPPLVEDPQPYWGSEFDPAKAAPAGSPRESYAPANVASNMTFASIPLTAAGVTVQAMLAGDRHPVTNQADIRDDIAAIAAHGTPTVAWRWYENGYDHEPSDPTPRASHANFVSHHDGPQYFGYIADNATQQPNLEGEGDFFTDVALHHLPPGGGIIYVRGGYANIQKLRVPIQNPAYPRPLNGAQIRSIQDAKSGDDDHPAYADRQISEAMNARVVNAIAADPALWAQSAIVITYDESDGFYDHVPPRILAYGPDSLPLARGIRVPLLVLSPYARAHSVSHAEGDHNAVIETINAIFNLPALSGLPDEAAALRAGNTRAFDQFGPPGFQQLYLGPRDTPSKITDSLLSAFDPKRLLGATPPLPASYAMIAEDVVDALPHYGGNGCRAIGIVPEDQRQGISAPAPANFNPLAATLPDDNDPPPP